MARATGGGSALAWRQRLRRHRRSGLTVAEFCSNEGVSVPSFYGWKRKLQVEAAKGGSNRGAASGPTFRAVSLVGTAPVMSARLPGGVALEVGVADLEVVRAVLAELVRADREAVLGEPRC